MGVVSNNVSTECECTDNYQTTRWHIREDNDPYYFLVLRFHVRTDYPHYTCTYLKIPFSASPWFSNCPHSKFILSRSMCDVCNVSFAVLSHSIQMALLSFSSSSNLFLDIIERNFIMLIIFFFYLIVYNQQSGMQPFICDSTDSL
jgi:hypothetical protein